MVVITEQNAEQLMQEYEKKVINSEILKDTLELIDNGLNVFKMDENGEIFQEKTENENVKIEINEELEKKLIEKGYSEEEIENVMNYLVASLVCQILKTNKEQN
jgi:alpha-glucosidase (family GH31 glycosyl hydrolase)